MKAPRPDHGRIDPADRLAWALGDAGHCDLSFRPRKIPREDGTARLLLVPTAAHSRFITELMIPTRNAEGLPLASRELLQRLGRVPRRLIWHNEPGISRGRRTADGVAAFMGTMATTLLLPPKDSEFQGIVERRNGWFETSFMPGRTFTSPADFNTQFADWLMRANSRVVRTTRAAPMDRLEADRAAMLPLPPIPLHLGWRNRVRLPRAYYVPVETSDYSVDTHLIGRLVDVTADLDYARVRVDGKVIADTARAWVLLLRDRRCDSRAGVLAIEGR